MPAARSDHSLATDRARSSSRPTMATLAPAAWSVRAISSPIPRVLPVTKAVFPERSRLGVMKKPLDLVCRSQCNRLGPGDDALQQAGENIARADLDKRGPRRQIRCRLHARDPTNRRGQLIGQETLRVDTGPDGFSAGVGDHGEGRIAEARVRQRGTKSIDRRRHQGRVEGATYLERNHPLCPSGLAALAGTLHAGRITGD